MIHRFIPLFLFLLFSMPIIGQKDTRLQADEAYEHLSYLKAAELYQQLGEQGLDLQSKLRLANSYRLTGDTRSAEYWYALSAVKSANPQDLLHYAQVLQSNGKCRQALEWYGQYRQLASTDKSLPRAGMIDCNSGLFQSKKQLKVKNLKEINSVHLDYSPLYYRGGLLFTSTRGKAEKGIEDLWTKDNFSDLFFASGKGGLGFGEASALPGAINGDYHDGTATVNSAGTEIYFSRNDEKGKNSKSKVSLKIYKASLNNQEWSNIEELPFNNKEYSTCHPTLSEDGQVLYFASNRPGGFGGMDLYHSFRTGGTWSEPENLGPAVNTAGNEIFPFIYMNKELFFASDGLPGLGGLDIYTSSLVDKQWTAAENLGSPLNSEKDDFAYSIAPLEDTGYFSSNREGGMGGDDIYQWNYDYTTQLLENSITVVDETSGDRIHQALITLVPGIHTDKKEIAAGVKISNNTVQVDKATTPYSGFLTDKNGQIIPDLNAGKTYTLLIEKPGYRTLRKVVASNEILGTQGWTVELKPRKGLLLEGSVINDEYNHVVPGAEAELFNLCTGEYERVLSDETGNFSFFLDCQCDYELGVKKDRFTGDKKQIAVTGLDCNSTKPLKTIMYLRGLSETKVPELRKPLPGVNAGTELSDGDENPMRPEGGYYIGQIITLEDVYYDFNKSSIRGDASIALDKLIRVLEGYPQMEVELMAHTDSRGAAGYNEDLSRRRARSAVDYMVNRGIERNRLTGRGYGERLLRNQCEDGVRCSEQEHQENRRTDIKITKL